jgi:hypothetical protein
MACLYLPETCLVDEDNRYQPRVTVCSY